MSMGNALVTSVLIQLVWSNWSPVFAVELQPRNCVEVPRKTMEDLCHPSIYPDGLKNKKKNLL
jgi:hypothetical protein